MILSVSNLRVLLGGQTPAGMLDEELYLKSLATLAIKHAVTPAELEGTSDSARLARWLRALQNEFVDLVIKEHADKPCTAVAARPILDDAAWAAWKVRHKSIVSMLCQLHFHCVADVHRSRYHSSHSQLLVSDVRKCAQSRPRLHRLAELRERRLGHDTARHAGSCAATSQ